MPLQPQPLPLQFSGGIETKQDSKQVPTTRLLTLENATFVKQSTLAKRNGYASLSKRLDTETAEYANAVGLGNLGEELLVFADERCYSYRPSSERWIDTGEVLSTVASEEPIARTGTDQDMPDHATNNGVTVVAWQDSRGGVRCSVVEAGTGRVLLADTLLDSAGAHPVCTPVGEVLHVYYRDSSGRIWIAVVNPATPTSAPMPHVLVDNLSTSNPRFDVTEDFAYYPAVKPALIAWCDDLQQLRVGYVHPSGVIGSPVTSLPSSKSVPVSVTGPVAISEVRRSSTDTALEHVYVAYCDTQPRAIVFTDYEDFTTYAGPVALSASTGTWDRVTLQAIVSGATSIAWWAGELQGSTVDKNIVQTGSVSQTAAVLTAARSLRGHRLASRAFYQNGNVYCLAGHEVFYFPYLALVRVSADSFGSDTQAFYRSFVGQWPGFGTNKQLPSVHSVESDSLGISDTHAIAITYRLQAESEDGDVFTETGVKLLTIDMDAELAYQSAELGRGLYLASSCQQHYDSLRWAEAGFHTAPDTASGVISTSQGGSGVLPDATVFLYRIIYEEIDAQGELHRSAPSSPVEVLTTGATRKITINLPAYRLTSKRRVRVGVFRSLANSESESGIDGIEFFRCSSLDPNVTGENGYVSNETTVDTITFIDNMSDETLALQEPLYTNGGILADDPSPMRGDSIAGGKNRLFWTDTTDPNVIRYSQQRAEETGVEMPVALKLQTDPYGGAIVGLGVMDGGVYAFCETSIYGFGGPGPLAAPQAGPDAFSTVDLVTSDCGCVSSNSICQSPVGITFQSEKGIRLLSRERSVIDIGAAVYAYRDQTITRATLLPGRSQILFLTSSGLSLLWDYSELQQGRGVGQWSTFTNHEGLDARVVAGSYYYLRTDGRVFKETIGQYRDDNSHIPMKIETAWVKLAGYLQGWQRILWAYFLGEWKSSHTLRVRYRIDYNAGYSSPVDMDVDTNIDPRYYGAGIYGADEYGNGTEDSTRYQRAIHFNIPCQAIQFRIEDVESTDEYGASFELSELLLIGGVLDSRAKIGPARIS
jgi:hypothetical protein